jgi:hypothetical protein
MTLTEAEFCINDSRQKLAAFNQIATQAKPDKLLALVREEIVRLELAAQNLPSRAVKIHRLIQAWRKCHAELWVGRR